jgi:hypothetical protein
VKRDSGIVAGQQQLLQNLQTMSDEAGAALDAPSCCGTIDVTFWVMVIHGV